MAKAAPAKKSVKAVKAKNVDAKKKRKTTRVESYSSYIHKVLKQVHGRKYSLISMSCVKDLFHPL